MSVAWVGAGIAAVGVLNNSKNASQASDANQAAIDANKWQGQIAQDQWDTYKKTYQPLEEGMVKDAQNYDTPQMREQAASDAQATVSEQFGKARDQLARAPGVDPSSPAYAASLVNLNMKQAAVDATSQNQARKGVQDMAWARKMDALGLGKGLVTNASNGMAAASLGAQRIAAQNGDAATSGAASIGKFAGNLLSSKGFQSWLNTPSSSAGGAGSLTSGGSVQGNPDYEFDL